MKKQVGDKQDTNLFGNLFMLFGSFLLSFVIFSYLNLFREIYWFNDFIVLGLGYLIFSLGFYIYDRDRKGTISTIRNLLLVLGIILILCLLIIF